MDAPNQFFEDEDAHQTNYSSNPSLNSLPLSLETPLSSRLSNHSLLPTRTKNVCFQEVPSVHITLEQQQQCGAALLSLHTGSTRVAVSPTPANTPHFPESYYINTESGSSLLLAPAVSMCLPAALTPMGCQGTTNEAPTFQCMPTSCATFPTAANAIVHGHRPPLGAIFASGSDAEAPERAGLPGFVAAGSQRPLQFSQQAYHQALATAAQAECAAEGWLSQLPPADDDDGLGSAAHSPAEETPGHTGHLNPHDGIPNGGITSQATGGFVAAGSRRAVRVSPAALGRAAAITAEVDRLAEQWLSQLPTDTASHNQATDPSKLNLVGGRGRQLHARCRGDSPPCPNFGQAVQLVTEIEARLRPATKPSLGAPCSAQPPRPLPAPEPNGGAERTASPDPGGVGFVRAGTGTRVAVSDAALAQAKLKALQAEAGVAEWLSQVAPEPPAGLPADDGRGGPVACGPKAKRCSSAPAEVDEPVPAGQAMATRAPELLHNGGATAVPPPPPPSPSPCPPAPASRAAGPAAAPPVPSGFATAGSRRPLHVSPEAYARAEAAARLEEARSVAWLATLPPEAGPADAPVPDLDGPPQPPPQQPQLPEPQPDGGGPSMFFNEEEEDEEGPEPPVNSSGDGQPSTVSVSNEGLPDEVSQPADIPAVDPMCSVYDVEPEMQGEKAPSPTSSPLLRPDRPSPPAPGSPASPRPRPPRPAPRRLSVGLPPSAASRARGLLRPFALPRSSSEGGETEAPPSAERPGGRRPMGVGIKRPRPPPPSPPQPCPPMAAEGGTPDAKRSSTPRHLGIRLRKSL